MTQHPDLPALFQQALRLHQQGRLDQAEKLYQRLLAFNPDHADTLCLLGTLKQAQGKLEEAAGLVQRAISLDPHEPRFACSLALICWEGGKHADALRYWEKATKNDPSCFEAWNNLGYAYSELDQHEPAIRAFRRALELRPNDAQLYNALGECLQEMERNAAAIDAYRQALRCNPRYGEAHSNLGRALEKVGSLHEGIWHYRQASQLEPHSPKVHSNLLYALSYNVLLDPPAMLAAHQEWDQRFGGPQKARTFSHHPDPDPDRTLRIAYLSPDFRQHAVSFFFEPLLQHHDPQQVEVFCYAEVKRPDHVTQRLQRLAHHWRSSVGLSDLQLAQRIHDDRIDILVDLAGHTAGNRLGACAYKPAPIQATYLGYCTTTGLAAMDYWITDHVLHPQDTVERAVETIYRLPRCWVAYKAPAAPPIQERAAEPVVFGTLNQFSKMTPQVVETWARILRLTPCSMLLLKNRCLADPQIRSRVQDMFAKHGISPQRLILYPASRNYLLTYGEIDIALDTFPRTGGATTADALWMGVPVVTLVGQRFIERQGLSLLQALGLDHFAAYSIEEYIEISVRLARDQDLRNRLRRELRQRMARSPLCNPRELAQHLERAFRKMWHNYLEQHPTIRP